jgi:hypothetical protein
MFTQLNPVLVSLMVVALAGCASNAKPISFADGSQGHVTSCSGLKSDWQECYAAAASACSSGYEVVEKEGFEHDGHIKRSLYFKCRR